MTEAEAEAILTTLRAAFPHADNGLDAVKARDRQALYRGVIKAWKQPKLGMQAARSIILTSKWWPMPADLEQAYNELARTARPERLPVAGLLSDGNTPATPEEVRAACAEAVAIVERNAVVPIPKPTRGSRSVEQAERELEGVRGRATPPELDRKVAGAGE